MQSCLMQNFCKKLIAFSPNFFYKKIGCVYSVRVTPVPIPNTEVKPYSGDGTAILIVGE